MFKTCVPMATVTLPEKLLRHPGSGGEELRHARYAARTDMAMAVPTRGRRWEEPFEGEQKSPPARSRGRSPRIESHRWQVPPGPQVFPAVDTTPATRQDDAATRPRPRTK